jgi:hypothetical protein
MSENGVAEIVSWMIEEKYAKNGYNAAAIANGLRLAGLPFEAQKERVKLYRRWRDSKIYNMASDCFAVAIEGKEPPSELFDLKLKDMKENKE